MWFIISIISFFLLALSAVIDKYILSKTKVVPVSFAFYIVFFGTILSLFLIPFEKHFYLPLENLVVLLIGGSCIFLGLYFMFMAISRSEVSKANPLIVSLTPLVVFSLSFFHKIELVPFYKVLGVFLIVFGGYFLSQVGHKKNRLTGNVWVFIIFSSIFLGLSNIYSKLAYEQLPFITAFFWLRVCGLFGAIVFVSLLGKWHNIFFKTQKIEVKEKSAKQTWTPFIIGQIAGSLGVIFLQYAINLGNVILVSALTGVQFFFVIILIFFISKFYPNIIKEDIKGDFMVNKIIFSLILFIGVILIII